MMAVKDFVEAVLILIFVLVVVVAPILLSVLAIALTGLFFAAPFACIALGILLPLHWFGVI